MLLTSRGKTNTRSNIWARVMRGVAGGLGLAVVLGAAGPAFAGEAEVAPTPGPSLDELYALIELQRQQIEAQRQTLEAQDRRIEALERTVTDGSAAEVRPALYRPPLYRPPPSRPAQATPAPPQPPREPQRQSIESALAAVAEETGVLTPEGTLVFEPSFEFTHASQNRVLIEGFTVIPAITIGNIDVRRVERDTLTAAATMRYGITDRFEVDVTVPYLDRSQDTTARALGQGASSDTLTSVNGDGLGDVELGAHAQLTNGIGGAPFLIGNLNVTAPTGTDPFEIELDPNGLEAELPTGSGFWAVEPSLTALLPTDPVVLWGNLGYVWNVSDDVTLQSGAETEIDPGDAVRLSFGMGFALNERTSFSLGYEHNFVLETEQDGSGIEGSDLQVGSLLFGGSYRLDESTSINVSVNAGVTEDSPDIRLLVRVPTSFDLLGD